jgi:hypothetical protein
VNRLIDVNRYRPRARAGATSKQGSGLDSKFFHHLVVKHTDLILEGKEKEES